MTSFDAGNLLQSMKLRDNHVFYPGPSPDKADKKSGIPPKAPILKHQIQQKADQSPMFANMNMTNSDHDINNNYTNHGLTDS